MHGVLSLLIAVALGADGNTSATAASIPLPRLTPPRLATEVERETWPLSLPDAIRIGLDNAETVRVLSLRPQGIPIGEGFEPPPPPEFRDIIIGAQRIPISGFEPAAASEPTGGSNACHFAMTVISQLNADTNPWRFKTDMMAHVRSVEQQYWSLQQQHVQLSCIDKAIKLTEEILKREQSDLESGRGTKADVAEATHRLEQLRLELVTKISDMITTERQFRNLVGLPPADNRRIAPVSVRDAVAPKVDWDDCVVKMKACLPDFAEHQEAVHAAAQRVLLALASESTTKTPGAPGTSIPVSPQAAKELEAWNRERASQTELLHRTMHSLARFYLEIDANWKQLQKAKQLQTAARQRLDAQRAFYEEGRLTIDRYLDAVCAETCAALQVAQFHATYNTSLAALEEAKGTLLDARNIVIALRPDQTAPPVVEVATTGRTSRWHEARQSPTDPAVTKSSAEAVGTACADAAKTCKREDDCDHSTATPATFTFQLSTGGVRSRVIHGAITIEPLETATPSSGDKVARP